MSNANIWEPGSSLLSVNANTTLITQIFTATEGQTVFNITAFEYAPATGSLLIFRNGQLIKLGISETSSSSFTVTTTDLNAGDEILAMGFVGITATTVDLDAPFSHAVTYLPQSVGTKLQLEVNLADAPFNCIAGDDISGPLQTAVDMAGVSRVVIPNIAYIWSQQVIVSRANIEIVGTGAGMLSDENATSIICTAGVLLDAMIYVNPGLIGFTCQDIKFDCANKAKTSIHRDVVSGGTSHYTLLRNLFIEGHKVLGLTLGDSQLVTLNSGQLTQVVLDSISFGTPGTAGADGLGINAQNCEFVCCTVLNFVSPGHRYHIFARAGGIKVEELISTGATGYGIKCAGSQVVIEAWRSEDRLLIQGDAVGTEGPCSFKNITHRATSSVFDDLTIDWSCSTGLSLSNINLKGSCAINSTQAKQLKLDINFLQKGAGAGYLIFGPQNNFGQILDMNTGQMDQSGTDPYIRCNLQDGTPVVGMDSGGFTFGSTKMTWGSAAPTTGVWHRGDIVWSILAAAGGKVGFVCILTGTPGTWKAFGPIDA